MLFEKKKKKIIGIEGMKDEVCANKVEKTLESLSNVDNVKMDIKKKTAIIYYSTDVDSLLLQKTIEDLGYTVTGIKEIH